MLFLGEFRSPHWRNGLVDVCPKVRRFLDRIIFTTRAFEQMKKLESCRSLIEASNNFMETEMKVENGEENREKEKSGLDDLELTRTPYT